MSSVFLLVASQKPGHCDQAVVSAVVLGFTYLDAHTTQLFKSPGYDVLVFTIKALLTFIQ